MMTDLTFLYFFSGSLIDRSISPFGYENNEADLLPLWWRRRMRISDDKLEEPDELDVPNDRINSNYS